MANTDNKPALIDWLTLIFLMFVWGSSFIFIKKGLIAFSPLQVGALRVGLSFIVLLPFTISRLKRVEKGDIKFFILAGLLGNGIPAFLFAIAQTRLDSFMAGILNSLTPVFTLVVGILFFGIRARWFNILGVFIGLIGAVGLLWSSSNGNISLNIFYSLAVIAATICYAFNMNIVKRFLSKYDTVTIVSVAFLFIGIPALIFIFTFTDFLMVMQAGNQSWISLGYIVILAFVGTSLAVILNVRIIKRTSAVFASSVTYLMPLVSIMWGVLDGEAFLLIFILWIIVILGGVYMANRRGV
ncbi:MAG: DMT family transporter [Bacteroidales bacterium]